MKGVSVRKQKRSPKRWLVGLCLLIIASVVLVWATRLGNEPPPAEILPMKAEPVVLFSNPDPSAPCDPNETWYHLGDLPSMYGSVIQVWSTDENGTIIPAEDRIQIVEGSLLCMNSTIKRLPSICSFSECMSGPGQPPAAEYCEVVDYDNDGDVDIFDFKQFQIDPHVNRDSAPG